VIDFMATENRDLNPKDIIGLMKLMIAEQKLQKLQHDLETLIVRSELEGINNREEISRIETEISQLQNQQKENEPESGIIQNNFKKQELLKERLSKLEQKRETVQPEVYQSLKEEYEQELQEINRNLDLILKQMEIARQQTQPLIQVLNYQLEELIVRKDIENIADGEFSERKKQIEDELDEKKDYLAALEYILQQVK
jgi:hypothetical protein